MTSSHLLIRENEASWSFTLNLAHYPGYLLLSLSGEPDSLCIQRLVEVTRHHLPYMRLPTGKLCPLIVDHRQDSVPSVEVVRRGRTLLAQMGHYLSCLVFLLDPHQSDPLWMERALEILALGSPVPIKLTASLEEAITTVVAYHVAETEMTRDTPE